MFLYTFSMRKYAIGNKLTNQAVLDTIKKVKHLPVLLMFF